MLCLLAVSTAAAAKPTYTADSIVNSASGQVGSIAANTLCTIYGKGLSWTTRQVEAGDIADGKLPTILPGTGVRVYVRNIPAYILYVSPTQINFLIPSLLVPGPAEVRVTLDGQAGPNVPVTLAEQAPALFLWAEDGTSELAAIAQRLLPESTWALATRGNPARPGETVVLYATGLGETDPPVDDGKLPWRAAEVVDKDLFDITLDGMKVERENIQYAGVAPTFGGLYQINLKLPDWVPETPEIRLSIKSAQSPAGIRLPVSPASQEH